MREYFAPAHDNWVRSDRPLRRSAPGWFGLPNLSVATVFQVEWTAQSIPRAKRSPGTWHLGTWHLRFWAQNAKLPRCQVARMRRFGTWHEVRLRVHLGQSHSAPAGRQGLYCPDAIKPARACCPALITLEGRLLNQALGLASTRRPSAYQANAYGIAGGSTRIVRQ